jgi:hypothetical protein
VVVAAAATVVAAAAVAGRVVIDLLLVFEHPLRSRDGRARLKGSAWPRKN